MYMLREKTIAASIVFIVVTIIKLINPGMAAQLRGSILPTIEYNVDYRSAMARLGESLTAEEGIIAALSRLGISFPTAVEAIRETEPEISPEPLPEPTTLEAELEPEPSLKLEPSPSPELKPEPEPSASPEASTESEADELSEAVAAFYDTQAAFDGMPDGVAWDVAELPFEHTTPTIGRNSSGFGYRAHPIDGGVRFHYGTDFAVYTGTEIVAFADGVVATAESGDGYGLYVVVSHEDGFSTLYAHCGELLVSAGQTVARGDLIAYSGNTGQTTGPHLHFELLCEGMYLNPEYFV